MKRRTAGVAALALTLLTTCGASMGIAGPLTKATQSLQASSGSDELAVSRSVSGNPPIAGLLLTTAEGDLLRPLVEGSTRSSVTPCEAGAGSDSSWSPDGSRLAFSGTVLKGTPTSKRIQGCDIYLVAADGTQLRRLTHTDSAVKPVWSPRGNQIVYSVIHEHTVTIVENGRRARGGAYAETARLWSIRPDGSGARPLDPAPHPAAVVNFDRMLAELERMIKREGRAKALRQLDERSSRTSIHDYAGSFTPDGSRIAFTRLLGYTGLAFRTAIMVMPSAGGTARPLIYDAGEPAFSPDGRLLAFDSARDQNGDVSGSEDFSHPATDLYLAQANGMHPRRLTHTRSIDELEPTFSPHGQTIAYTHGESTGAAECTSIWGLPASGGPLRPILADPRCSSWYSDPAWRP